MRVTVYLFAVCRERAGASSLEVEIPGDSATLVELKRSVAQVAPMLEPLLSVVRVAVNQQFATQAQQIRPGDEVALIPPVSGGSGLGPFEIRDEPIRLEEVERAVGAAAAGAVVSFAGTVREKTDEHEVVGLDYEAYRPMAVRYLRMIGEEVVAQHPESRVAILHRVGSLSVGDVSVVIAVSHPHRAQAFEGCRHAIERLKQDVPIWKRERRKDGSVWVGVGS